jgi:protein-S-isoprenylcysteine O-methyltransferase Ste14
MTIMIKVLIYMSYLFGTSEFILTIIKRSKQKSVKMKNDKGSLIILWVLIILGIVAGFNLADYRKWSSLNYIIYAVGILVYLVGLIIRWIAIFQLKKAFTVDVAISHEHELKTDGLYSIVRHPSYLGNILIVSGLSIGMNSLLSFLAVTIPVFLAISYRIYVEEAILMKEFGQKYEEYCRTTKRIIPFIY